MGTAPPLCVFPAMRNTQGSDNDDRPDGPAQSVPGCKNSLMPSATGIRRAAMDWLARREHARCEIEQKLRRRFPDATAAIGPVLDDLEREGLLDTARFIEQFIQSRIRRGHGPRRITAALRERGITFSRDDGGPIMSSFDDESALFSPKADVSASGDTWSSRAIAIAPSADCSAKLPSGRQGAGLDGIDWLFQAREARRKRFGEALPSGPVERNRQMAFLQRRGFALDVCRRACLPVREDE